MDLQKFGHGKSKNNNTYESGKQEPARKDGKRTVTRGHKR